MAGRGPDDEQAVGSESFDVATGVLPSTSPGPNADRSMKSAPRGERASDVEVTKVTQHGFWIFIGEREVHVSFGNFPWFEDASIREIAAVEQLSPRHLYWPELDVDLLVDSLDHPDRYPLVSWVHRADGGQRDAE